MHRTNLAERNHLPNSDFLHRAAAITLGAMAHD